MAMVRYRILFDEPFLVDLLDRYRRTKSRSRNAIKWILGGFLAFAAVSSLLQGWPGMAIFWLSVIVAMIYAHRIDDVVARWKFRRSPSCGEVVTLTLGAEGVHTVSASHDATFFWSAYTRAVALPDGMVLFRGKGTVQWLPDRLLVTGSREDAESLVRSRIADVRGTRDVERAS